MGRKGLYSEKKKVKKARAPMFQNVAPAGKDSTDPYGDIASALLMVAIGGICHMWSKTMFTKVLFIMMCVVAVYLAGRAVGALIKKNKK